MAFNWCSRLRAGVRTIGSGRCVRGSNHNWTSADVVSFDDRGGGGERANDGSGEWW
jgi:hypothetical protein